MTIRSQCTLILSLILFVLGNQCCAVTNLEESVPLTELLMELTEIKVIEEEEGRSRGTVFLSFEENENWRQFVKGRF